MSAAITQSLRSLFRLDSARDGDIRRDVLWLLALSLLLIGTGIGLRDPWPADEPRFALVARDMVGTGEWLVPRVGGDIYADKPPLFFWMMAVGIKLTGSVKLAFRKMAPVRRTARSMSARTSVPGGRSAKDGGVTVIVQKSLSEGYSERQPMRGIHVRSAAVRPHPGRLVD